MSEHSAQHEPFFLSMMQPPTPSPTAVPPPELEADDQHESAAAACGCGRPIAIAKTSECGRCYQRRRRRERTEQAKAKPCRRCRLRSVEHVARRLCGPCDVVERRRAQAKRDATHPISYHTAHSRIRQQRGPASRWHCIACGARATQWAYRSGSPREVFGVVRNGTKAKRMAWSPDPADYEPRCDRCHRYLDRGEPGYRSSPERRRAAQRRWNAATYARQVATPAGREAYRARKRAERERRQSRRATGTSNPTDEGD